MSIQIYYSSGSLTNSEFQKNPSQSIGGLITATKIVSGLHNLFGYVSLRDSQIGAIDYRCVYVKNDSITNELQNVKLWIDKPYIETTQINPDLLTPSLNSVYLIPENATSVWLNKSGYLATWNGTTWIYSLPYLYTFEFGIDNNETIQVLNSVYDIPYGIEFTSATSDDGGVTNFLNLNNINQSEYKVIWIKRIITTYSITNIDFTLNNTNLYNQPIKENKSYVLNVFGDSMDGISIIYSTPTNTNLSKDVTYPLNFYIRTILAGEINYDNLKFEFLCNYNGIENFSYITAIASFRSVSFNNIQINNIFGNFDSNNTMNDILNITISFLDTGIFDLIINILDINNDDNIIATSTFRFTVS